MTVKELIEELQKMPQDVPVCTHDDDADFIEAGRVYLMDLTPNNFTLRQSTDQDRAVIVA